LRNFGKLLTKFRIHLTDTAGMLKLWFVLQILPCYTGGQEPKPLEAEPRQKFYPEPELEPCNNDVASREKLRNFGKLWTKFRFHLTARACMLKV
jgi:hypothetical protein